MGITSEDKYMTYSTDTRFFEKVEEEKLEVSEILALVYEALKEKGITSYSARETKALPQGTFTTLKSGMFPTGSLDKLCTLLQMQPGDIVEWVPDEK